VASLWKVDDKATQTLMVEFYENLWRKKMSRVEALRQAQLTMLREGVNRGIEREGPEEENGRLPPYYWAAFVLSGDWR
jgi:CHAT domain-containing protein